MHDIVALLEETGSANGLVGFGVCDTEPFADVRAEMDRRLAGGESGRLRFTYADPGVATDVRRSFPWAIRLVLGATTYLPAGGNPGRAQANRGRVARFATSDHYQPLQRGLGAVRGILQSAGHRAEVLVDDNRLVDRAAAVRAGIAWWGRSTMVLTPRYGPWTLLGSVVTDAELPVSSPMVRDCGTCVACIPACPTGALDEEGTLDATRCISYWAQMPGSIPADIRAAWSDRLYGCDDCLDACPPGQRWLAVAQDQVGRVDLLGLLAQPDSELRSTYAHFYMPRNDPVYLRRNALVALGHSGGLDAVPIVAGYLRNPRPLLRAHAAWSLSQIGGSEAVVTLETAFAEETDPTVRAEIESALASRATRSEERGAGGYSVVDGGPGCL